MLLQPFVDPASRTWWVSLGLAAFVGVAVLVWRRELPGPARLRLLLSHPSTRLDVQLLLGRQLLFALWGGSLFGSHYLAQRVVLWLDHSVGVPEVASGAWVTPLYAVCLFVAWDASRFALHYAMHRIPALWALHQVHHSAEVLTPLTFHRLHPLESVLYQLRGAVVTVPLAALFYWLFREAAVDWTLMGVHGIGLLLNAAFGNLRHSHVWLGFGALERWFISPAQHQIHHSADPMDFDTNFGTWLAVWDRWAGTWRAAGAAAPERFGVPATERNHGHDLLSAWFGPLRSQIRRALPALASVLLALPAQAQEPEATDAEDAEAPEDEEDIGIDIVVVGDKGFVRAAGSAHQIAEEQLEQFEYDDIERVVSTIPGVTTRGEDGFGLRPNIGIRGVNSDRSAKITLLEDGIPLVPAPYAAPAAYYFPMSTRLVGVEVFKGPAATLHGPNTIGGVINLKTRAVPDQLDGAADIARGLRNTTKLHGWTGSGSDRGGWLIEGTHLQTDGFKQLASGADTGFDRTELMFKSRLQSDPALRVRHALELKLGYGNETSNETYLGLSTGDYEANPYLRYPASELALMKWSRTQAELSWPVQVGDDLQIRTVAYHHYITRQWTKFNRFNSDIDLHQLLQADSDTGLGATYLAVLRGEADSETEDQLLRIGTNDRRFHAVGVESRARYSHYGDTFSHVLQAGLRVHGDLVRRIHTEDAFAMTDGTPVQTDAPTDLLLDSDANALAVAAHVHEDLGYKAFHVLPGLRTEIIRTERLDNDEVPEDAVTRVVVLPGIGVLQSVSGTVDLFAGAYRGFSPVAPGQPAEVNPEQSWNYETGFRWGKDGHHTELVGFVNDYVNLTGNCTISGGCFGDQLDQQFNGGKVLVYGVESTAGSRVMLPGRLALPIAVSYALNQSRFRTSFVSGFPQFGEVEAGDRLPYVPEHSGSLRVTLESQYVRAGLGSTMRSGMRDAASQGPLGDGDVPPLFLLDAAVDAQLTPELMAYATATNLTNSTALTSWRPFGARPVAPFQVMVGVKVRPAAP